MQSDSERELHDYLDSLSGTDESAPLELEPMADPLRCNDLPPLLDLETGGDPAGETKATLADENRQSSDPAPRFDEAKTHDCAPGETIEQSGSHGITELDLPWPSEREAESAAATTSVGDALDELGDIIAKPEAVAPAHDFHAETRCIADHATAGGPAAGTQIEATANLTEVTASGADFEAGSEESFEASRPPVEADPPLDSLIASIDEEVDQDFSSSSAVNLALEAPEAPAPKEHHVIFTMAGTAYSVPIGNVIEIGQTPAFTPLPNVPDWVRGVANLRGDIISIVDLRTFLGLERSEAMQNNRMLVVRSRREDITSGLIVDQVREIRYLNADQISAPTAPVENQIAPYMRGVYEHQGRLLVLLDLERLICSPEMRQFELVSSGP